jgi:hypothetical protein
MAPLLKSTVRMFPVQPYMAASDPALSREYGLRCSHESGVFFKENLAIPGKSRLPGSDHPGTWPFQDFVK